MVPSASRHSAVIPPAVPRGQIRSGVEDPAYAQGQRGGRVGGAYHHVRVVRAVRDADELRLGRVHGARRGHRRDGHREVRHVAQGLGLRLDAAGEERVQLGGEHRVVGAVVDPAPAEDAVLGRADEGVLGAVQRLPAVGEGDEVRDGSLTLAVGRRHELDADLARGVVEPEAADPRRSRRRPRVPRAGGEPLGEQLQLGGLHRGLVDDGHRAGLPLVRGPAHLLRGPGTGNVTDPAAQFAARGEAARPSLEVERCPRLPGGPP